MSDPSKKIIPLRAGDKMIVQLSVGELRAIIREEVQVPSNGSAPPDEWVDVETAAKIMSVSSEWIYHNRKRLPFACKIGRKMLRFSLSGLQEWMRSKKA
jgi:predicted DNA-binding transcriptional regulator AlpA